MDIEKLQNMSLISAVSRVLDAELGFSDATLAEFIIHLALEAKSTSAFSKMLNENGAKMEDRAVEDLLATIRKLSGKPPLPRAAAGSKASDKDNESRKKKKCIKLWGRRGALR